MKRRGLQPLNQLVRLRARWRDQLAHWLWYAGGRRPPPPAATKARMLARLARQYDVRTFVETGTYYGDMVAALRQDFDQIYTIELSDELCHRARERFADDAAIHVLYGDSGEMLPQLLDGLDTPALFWLDGHYSGGITAKGSKETPIIEELTALAAHGQRQDVIVIDDVHCHGVLPDYPTLPELCALLRRIWPRADVRVVANMVQVLPGPPG